jgi:hypothetical protein
MYLVIDLMLWKSSVAKLLSLSLVEIELTPLTNQGTAPTREFKYKSSV